MNMHVAISLRMSHPDYKNNLATGSDTINLYKNRMDSVATAVSFCSGFSISELKAKTKKWDVVSARNIFCYICKEKKKVTLSAIGKYLNKDHTTIMHSVKQVKKLIESDDEIIVQLLNKTLNILS